MSADLFRIDFPIKEMISQFEDLSRAAQGATVATLNKVGRLANRNAAKDIKSRYNVRASDLKIGKAGTASSKGGKVRLIRASSKSLNPTFRIFVFQFPRGLMRYGAKPRGAGVRVRIKKKSKFIRNAFISTWKAGEGEDKKRVFVRDRKLGFYVRAPKNKLRVRSLQRRVKRRMLFGPSIADFYKTRRVSAIIRETVNKEFQRVLDEEFNNQFERRR